MADDGKGESVYIPTFLISFYDGLKLKEAIHHVADPDEDQGEQSPNKDKKNKVIIQADVDLISKTDDIIQIDLWYSGAYELSQIGLNFEKYSQMQEIFKDQIRFQPRTMTTSCESCSDLTKQ